MVGFGVTRFALGDRIATNASGVLRNDSRFGFCLFSGEA